MFLICDSHRIPNIREAMPKPKPWQLPNGLSGSYVSKKLDVKII
jgi:hypothetical protein